MNEPMVEKDLCVVENARIPKDYDQTYNCTMDHLRVLRDRRVIRVRGRDRDWLGLGLTATAGVGLGIFAGMAIRQLLGSVDTDRVRDTVGRLGRSRAAPDAAADGDLERVVNGALGENATTRHLAVRAHAIGDGIVELTGTAPDPEARALAATIARGVAGSAVVVNRILVEGETPRSSRRKPPRAG